MVLNILTGVHGEYEAPSAENLIAFQNILALPKILGWHHEGALFPLELAHNISSLSTYPSARMLTLFSEAANKVIRHAYNNK